MEGPIRIAYVCDKHYLPYLQKSIESVKRYNKNVDIVILTGNKDLEVPNTKTFYYKIDTSNFKFKNNDRMKDGVYYKLFLPLLPYDKILYIDCDVICQRPLNELWNIDCPFICATESYKIGKQQAKDLHLPNYYLTGMMLMNLKELRRQNFTQKCLDRLSKENPKFHDETIINLEFNDQIKNINIKYNYCKNRPYDNPISENDAYLLHYVGSDKNQMLKRTNFESLSILKDYIKNKSIAIVGNSQNIFNTKFGKDIDNHDIVIRFNKGYPIKKESQGTKTDILFLACTLNKQELNKFNVKYTIKRSNYCGNDCNFYLQDNDKYQFIQERNNESKRIGEKISHPSTGFIAIQFCLSSECKSIDLYGFDFFKNPTYYNQPNYKTLHNGDKEFEKILEYKKYKLLNIDTKFIPFITKVSAIYGIGDALNARAFLAEYCRQKNVNRNTIKIYSPKHWWMFEDMGFMKDDNASHFSNLTSYRNFGNYDLPKTYEDDKLDLCIAKNAGINFTFNHIEPLPKYSEPKINLPDKFITFNTGYGILSGKPLNQEYICIKAWPIEYWERLIKILKIPCIQIGSGVSCKIVSNAYLNLVDKLTLKQSAEVMRKALFHIDIEGGLTILNQHLGKKSVVLFGPTAIENQGRVFNLNIRNSECPACYEWGKHTKSLCMKKEELKCNAHCMIDLTPEYVIQKIKESGLLP